MFAPELGGLDREQVREWYNGYRVEESSSHGRVDMAVRTAGHVYLFEFKVAEMAPPGSALAQLQQRRYADKYFYASASDGAIKHIQKKRTVSRFGG